MASRVGGGLKTVGKVAVVGGAVGLATVATGGNPVAGMLAGQVVGSAMKSADQVRTCGTCGKELQPDWAKCPFC